MKLICLFLFFGFISFYYDALAGEASNAGDALKTIGDKIEAGDFSGVSKYFTSSPKNEQVLKLMSAAPLERRKLLAKSFREAQFKTYSVLKGYEGAQHGDEYRTYVVLFTSPGKPPHPTDISLCGNSMRHEWLVCNW